MCILHFLVYQGIPNKTFVGRDRGRKVKSGGSPLIKVRGGVGRLKIPERELKRSIIRT